MVAPQYSHLQVILRSLVKEAVNGDMDVMDIVEESKNYLQSRLGIKKTSEDLSWRSDDPSTAALETEEV